VRPRCSTFAGVDTKTRRWVNVVGWTTGVLLYVLSEVVYNVVGGVCVSVDCPGADSATATSIFIVLVLALILWAIVWIPYKSVRWIESAIAAARDRHSK
jgi:hypothetical protein